MLRKSLELLGKILLPFGIGAAVGFAVDYYEMQRLARLRLRDAVGGDIGSLVVIIVVLVRWFLDWVRPLLELVQRLL